MYLHLTVVSDGSHLPAPRTTEAPVRPEVFTAAACVEVTCAVVTLTDEISNGPCEISSHLCLLC